MSAGYLRRREWLASSAESRIDNWRLVSGWFAASSHGQAPAASPQSNSVRYSATWQISMSAVVLQTALNLLKNSGVTPVVIGELVLNYYNVPCILHVAFLYAPILTEPNMLQEIEICVPSSQFSAAELTLNSCPLFEG